MDIKLSKLINFICLFSFFTSCEYISLNTSVAMFDRKYYSLSPPVSLSRFENIDCITVKLSRNNVDVILRRSFYDIRPSIYIISIVNSLSNPFPELTSTKQCHCLTGYWYILVTQKDPRNTLGHILIIVLLF